MFWWHRLAYGKQYWTALLGIIMHFQTMAMEDIANAVVHIASLPLDVNVVFVTIMATNVPYIGLG